jgi:hypothetical protein
LQSYIWRSIIWAIALSVLAHFFAIKAISSSFSLSFSQTDAKSSMITRTINTAQSQPPAPQLLAGASMATVATPVAQKPIAPAPTPQPSASASTANDLEKQPVAVIEPRLDATQKVAELAPSTPDTDTNTENQAASAQPSSAALPATKLQYPANAQLVFDAVSMNKGQPRSGSGQLSWRSDGAEYEINLDSRILGITILSQASVGSLSQQGLAPERYSDKRFNRSERATHFRRDQGKIQFSNNKPDAVLNPGAQDRLSVMVQLAGIIGGDPERLRALSKIQMQVAGSDNSEVWEFTLEAMSEITVPAAQMQALKLSRTPRNEFDQRLELWLSPELGYLPVRIRQSSAASPEQEFTDLVLRKLP